LERRVKPAGRNIALALTSLAIGVSALAVRVTMLTSQVGCGIVLGGTLRSPFSSLPGWAFDAMVFTSMGLAISAMALEIRRRFGADRTGGLENSSIRVAVFGPALGALAFLAFAVRPAMCA